MGRAPGLEVLPRGLSISLSRIPGPHSFLTGPGPGYLPLHEKTLQQLQRLGSWGVCMWRAALGAPSSPFNLQLNSSKPFLKSNLPSHPFYCWIIFQTSKINVFTESVTITPAWNSILRTFRTFEYRLSFRWSRQVMKSKPRRVKQWGRAQSIIFPLHLRGAGWGAHGLDYNTPCTFSQIPNFHTFS